jgi:peptide/nickel transport system substrate-binding protein
MNKYRIVGLISMLLVLCLLLSIAVAACGPGATPTASPRPSTTASGPKMGGVLRISPFQDAGRIGFTPTITTLQDQVESRACIEELLRLDANGNSVGWLAEKYSFDPAAKTITLNLRKDVKYHDGTDFNAAAVKWNLDKFMASGRTEIPKGTTVDIVDDYTVKLTMPDWDNTAVTQLGYYAGPMISPTAWKNAPGAATDKDRDAWCENNPVGTGPFQFVSWAKTTKLVFKKFPGYWQKGKPYLDGLEWATIPDSQVSSAAFKAKEIDVIFRVSPIVAKDLKAGGYSITVLQSGLGAAGKGIYTYSADPKSPFSDLRVRQAVSYAIDRQSLADALFYGYAIPMQQYSPPGSQWTNPDFKGYAYDPAKAKQLMVDAGFANGFKTQLLLQNNADDVTAATAIQANLAKIGITAEVTPTEAAKHSQIIMQQNIEGMDYNTIVVDADPLIQFSRIIAAPGVQFGKSIIHPDETNKLIAEARKATDAATKKKLVWQIQQLVFEKYCTFSPVLAIAPIAAIQPYVKGDGIMQTWPAEFTPENAWLDK